MSTGSRGQIVIRTTDLSLVFGAIDRDLGRFRLRRREVALESGPGARPHLDPPAGPDAVWFAFRVGQGVTWVLPEDLQGLFKAAWSIHGALGTVPVIASRQFAYGAFEVKGYVDRELVFKAGDDADSELAWVPSPITRERVVPVAAAFGGGAIADLVSAVADRRATTSDWDDAFRGGPTREAFPGTGDGWRHVVWSRP